MGSSQQQSTLFRWNLICMSKNVKERQPPERLKLIRRRNRICRSPPNIPTHVLLRTNLTKHPRKQQRHNDEHKAWSTIAFARPLPAIPADLPRGFPGTLRHCLPCLSPCSTPTSYLTLARLARTSSNTIHTTLPRVRRILITTSQLILRITIHTIPASPSPCPRATSLAPNRPRRTSENGAAQAATLAAGAK